jgi:Fe-S cluster assembly scaffold protein SufB
VVATRVGAFVPHSNHHSNHHAFHSSTSTRGSTSSSSLFVSIGLGPGKEEVTDAGPVKEYVVPNHEEYRLTRRSRLDEQCDAWFGRLLNAGDNDNDSSDNSSDNSSVSRGVLGELSAAARTKLTTLCLLTNDIEKPTDDPEWTPYVQTRLPWTPLTPAYGLEEFGLPVPRRNAETWRHFDVPGMVAQDYSAVVDDRNSDLASLSEEQVADLTAKLKEAGGWLDDTVVEGRLIYINGRFVPQLSKTSDVATNLNSLDGTSQQVQDCLARLTDGFTDELAVPVDIGSKEYVTLQSKLSGPNHNTGDPYSQFAINTQQGTACFAALNTLHTGAVAYIHSDTATTEFNEDEVVKPVLVVNAVTPSGGCSSSSDDGVTFHPRTLVIGEEGSRVSVIQSSIDIDFDSSAATTTTARPKLYNGYTQIFVKARANVTHSCLEESGGIVTPAVELPDDHFAEGVPLPRDVEAARPELRDTHLEAIDVHITGDNGAYTGTMMNMGGSGRVRVAMSVALLCTASHASVNGFSLSGGAQRSDMKTNIMHVGQGTTSRQVQKNMIGGRSTGSFRGRIRVEQSAQQTDSQQLARTILLSDRARAWAVPSLEIIADDVQCTHGATVSDLSEEELFYLRSRGLSRAMARNLLMYAFAGDVSSCVDASMLGQAVDSKKGLQQRIIRRLENLVPQGERKVKGEFQSS